MPLLFSYGTLQHAEVQQATFSRLLEGHRDELPRFEPSLVRIEDPRILATGKTHHANVTFNGRDDSRVAGTVYDVTDAELAAADVFEKPFAYSRRSVTLASGKQAWVYVESGGGVLGGIGNTPLVELRRIVPSGSARVFLKLEWANPTGSMKDRMAKAAIEAAEMDGRLSPGGTVVEYTAGTTGVSLAFVCAAKGYGLEIVFSDAFSDEKRRTMEAFGARITDVKSDDRKITEALIKEMIQTAADLSQRPGHWYCDQLRNHDAVAGYVPLGEEIWTQTNGNVSAFVHAVSTAHSIHGVTQALWAHDPRVHVVAVEPEESAVLSGRPTGSHRIEGIGIGFVPPLWRRDLVNEIERVSTDDARAMARRLAHTEGVFAGISTGANVAAALRLAQRLGPEATVVTLAVDSGLRYLSTDLFRPVPEVPR